MQFSIKPGAAVLSRNLRLSSANPHYPTAARHPHAQARPPPARPETSSIPPLVHYTETSRQKSARGFTVPAGPKKPSRKPANSPPERTGGIVDYDSFRVQPATRWETVRRHGYWWDARKHVLAALRSMAVPPLRIERMENCGAAARVKLHIPTSKVLCVSDRCHDRACHPCQLARGRMIAGHLRQKLSRGDYLHIIMTLRSTGAPLADQVQHLLQSFRTLRKKRWWMGRPRTIDDRSRILPAPPSFPWHKRRRWPKARWRKAWRRCWFRWARWTPGGCYFIECTLNPETLLWHPHLHIICSGRFIPHQFLAHAWEASSGGSPVVWIERVRDPASAANEVSKYVSKPLKKEIFEHLEKTQELLTAWKGLRLCSCFGRWRGFRLTTSDGTFCRNDLKDMGPLEAVARAAANGDAWAEQTMAALFPPRTFSPRTTPMKRRLDDERQSRFPTHR